MDEQTYIYIHSWVETIETALNNVATAIKESSLHLPANDGNMKESGDDFNGIPLDSVHHPQNPRYLNNPLFVWHTDINMWRRK